MDKELKTQYFHLIHFYKSEFGNNSFVFPLSHVSDK